MKKIMPCIGPLGIVVLVCLSTKNDYNFVSMYFIKIYVARGREEVIRDDGIPNLPDWSEGCLISVSANVVETLFKMFVSCIACTAIVPENGVNFV